MGSVNEFCGKCKECQKSFKKVQIMRKKIAFDDKKDVLSIVSLNAFIQQLIKIPSLAY